MPHEHLQSMRARTAPQPRALTAMSRFWLRPSVCSLSASRALEQHLEDLAVQARSSSKQDLLMTEGLHYTLPLLLTRAPAGTAAEAFRMKAQAARLMANLAYQPAHKGAIVEAGGLRALANAAYEAIPHADTHDHHSTTSPPATALLLEVAAAIGNLASGADARRAVVNGESDVAQLLSRLLRAPMEADRAPSPQPAHSSPPTPAAAIAGEAARALSNLSLCSSTHHRILAGGVAQSALPLLLSCTSACADGTNGTLSPPPACHAALCERCKGHLSSIDAGAVDGDHGTASSEDSTSAEAPESTLGAPGTGDVTGGTRMSDDAVGQPLLGRLLTMLSNLLRHGEMAATLLAKCPGLEAALLHVAISRGSEARGRAFLVCTRLATAHAASGHTLIDQGAIRVLATVLADTPADALDTLAPGADVATKTSSAPASAPASATAERVSELSSLMAAIEGACALVEALLREASLRARLLGSPRSGATALLCALHASWSRLAAPPDRTGSSSPPSSIPANPAASKSSSGRGKGEPTAIASLNATASLRQAHESAVRRLGQCCAELERWSPGLYAHALAAHVEPALWSGCDGCHQAAGEVLSQLALAPALGRDAAASSVLPRAAALLASSAASSPATHHAVLTALCAVVQSRPETAVALALGGAVPALMHLHRRRRSPAGVRDLSARLLCTLARHGEVGSVCVQHGVLSALICLLSTHPDPTLCEAAGIALVALASPSAMLHTILAAGELSPLLAFLHTPHDVHSEAHASRTTTFVIPLLEISVAAAQPALHTAVTLQPLLAAADDDPAAQPPVTAAHIERLLLLARFGEPKIKTNVNIEPLVDCTLSHEYALGTVNRCSSGQVSDKGDSGAALLRACQLRQACASVLSMLLRRRCLTVRPGAPQPSLAVHAALGVYEALAERRDREAHGEVADADGDVLDLMLEPNTSVVADVLTQVTLAALEGSGDATVRAA